MVHKIKQRVVLPNAVIGDRSDAPLNRAGQGIVASGTIRIERLSKALRQERFRLEGQVISIPSASDFGGLQLGVFPNRNCLLAGWELNTVGTVSSPNVGTNLTLGLGTAVAAATPLATTAIAYMAAKTGVGAAQAFTCIGHSFDESSPALNFLDATASNNIFINAAMAVASGTGTVTFGQGSYVDCYYWDFGEPVALA